MKFLSSDIEKWLPTTAIKVEMHNIDNALIYVAAYETQPTGIV